MANWTERDLMEELEDSLRRLKTDVIDLYQVYWPDESVSFEETARTLDAFRSEGKIRAIGISNFSPAQMDQFRKGAPLATILSCGRRAARSLRPRAIWEVRACARSLLAARSRQDCRALGSPPPGAACAGQGGDGLDARRERNA